MIFFSSLSLSNIPDIKSHDVKSRPSIEEPKLERVETERNPLSWKEENKLQNCFHNENAEKCKITAVSIESLIESQDVSYIDDENDCEAVKHINKERNKPTQKEVAISATHLNHKVSKIEIRLVSDLKVGKNINLQNG